jgi:hypothetical protein
VRFLRVPFQEEHDQLSPCDGRLQLVSRKGQAMLEEEQQYSGGHVANMKPSEFQYMGYEPALI